MARRTTRRRTKSTLKALRSKIKSLRSRYPKDVEVSFDFQERNDFDDTWNGDFFGMTTAEKEARKGRRKFVVCIYVGEIGADTWTELDDTVPFTL